MVDGINLADVTGWVAAGGLCVFVVVALVKGWIVPGNVARMWFEAWQTDRHTVEKLADQTAELTKGQQVVTTFIGEIKAAGTQAEQKAKRERSP